MKYKHEQKNRIEARVTRSMTSRKDLYGNKVSVKKMNVKRYEKDVVQDCPKLFDTNEKHKTFSLPDIVQAVEWYQKNRTLLKSKKRNKTKNVYEYINHRTLDNLLPALSDLKALNDMIGMTKVKQTVVEHVLYLVQDLSSEEDFNHIQIIGEPGTGKSTLAVILGKLYCSLGLLQYGDVITATRSDLIRSWLGSTAQKTTEVLELATGNVLLLDEIYSLGCYDNRDSFSKECIDTINAYLSEHRHELLVVICGYKQEIRDCFFAHNKGLERRFAWTYELDKYTPSELKHVFEYQIKTNEWCIAQDKETQDQLDSVFSETNEPYFTNFGGDCEILFTRCKVAHSSRIFCCQESDTEVKTLTSIDIKHGFELFQEHKKSSSSSMSLYDKKKYSMMYV